MISNDRQFKNSFFQLCSLTVNIFLLKGRSNEKVGEVNVMALKSRPYISATKCFYIFLIVPNL
jgi:hypothetical protein